MMYFLRYAAYSLHLYPKLRFPDDTTAFAVISVARTGSNLLCGMLNTHPDCLCHHEVYHKKEIYYALTHRDGFRLDTLEGRNRDPFGFLEKVYHHREGNHAVGIKIFPSHNPHVLRYILSEHRIKKVFLKRNNLLETYVSLLRAKKTSTYAQLADGPRAQASGIQIRVDPRRFKRYAGRISGFYDKVESIAQKNRETWFQLEYAQLTRDEPVGALVTFLGLSGDVKLRSLHNKQGRHSLRETITNWDELQRRLANTPYARFMR